MQSSTLAATVTSSSEAWLAPTLQATVKIKTKCQTYNWLDNDKPFCAKQPRHRKKLPSRVLKERKIALLIKRDSCLRRRWLSLSKRSRRLCRETTLMYRAVEGWIKGFQELMAQLLLAEIVVAIVTRSRSWCRKTRAILLTRKSDVDQRWWASPPPASSPTRTSRATSTNPSPPRA